MQDGAKNPNTMKLPRGNFFCSLPKEGLPYIPNPLDSYFHPAIILDLPGVLASGESGLKED